MPPPTDTPLLLCGIGLFLTVVEVNGFGFDVADDTVGFLLVCVGALRLSSFVGRRLSLLTAVAAGLAALVSLFTYGGPAGVVLPMTHRFWDQTFLLDTATTAGVVIGLLLVVWSRARPASSAPPWSVRALPLLAVTYLVAAALSVPLVTNPSAYVGMLGNVRQAVGVLVGAVQGLTAVAVLLAARTGSTPR
jgi:hypothetical protein